jgi:hypothetical protein
VSIETADPGAPKGRRLSSTQLAFKIGARVRLSKLGRQRFRRWADVHATVVGYSRSASAVNVVFDGNKSSASLHTSYLVADAD